MKAATPFTPQTESDDSQKDRERIRLRRNRYRELRRQNPIAKVIDELSEEMAWEIVEVINETVGEKIFYTGNVPGCVKRYPNRINFTRRRTTNEEACKLPFEISFYSFRVDCRHHMPMEAAAYLESLATRMLKAAVAVRGIPDSRSQKTVKIIRGLVSGRIKAKYCGRKRQFVIVQPERAAS